MDHHEDASVRIEGGLELKHADSSNSIPPPPPPPVPPVATVESDDLLDGDEEDEKPDNDAQEEKIIVKEDTEGNSRLSTGVPFYVSELVEVAYI